MYGCPRGVNRLAHRLGTGCNVALKLKSEVKYVLGAGAVGATAGYLIKRTPKSAIVGGLIGAVGLVAVVAGPFLVMLVMGKGPGRF